MSAHSRWSAHVWVLGLALAVVFAVAVNLERAARVAQLSASEETTVVAPVPDAASPTGYADGKRRFITPTRSFDAYHWIAQTQQMLARGEWRVRQVDYDNAPSGRAVHWASPYRWWLGAVALADHAISGAPVGMSVERAALFADPLLQVLATIALALFGAKRWGAAVAAWLAGGMVLLFPFALFFLAGAPDHHGLAQLLALASVLLLLAGNDTPAPRPGGTEASDHKSAQERARRCHVAAGIAAGLGLWISAASEIPVLVGIGLGAVFAAGMQRGGPAGGELRTNDPQMWRSWGFAGGATSLVAYLIEYFPSHLGWRLEVNHPLYSLAVVGAGELLALATAAMRRTGAPLGNRARIRLVLAAAAVAAPATLMVRLRERAFVLGDPLLLRVLDRDLAETQSVGAFLAQHGMTPAFFATCAPVALLVPALLVVLRRMHPPRPERALVALALGPALVALVLASLELRWWNLLDASLLALAVACALARRAQPRVSARWVWSVAAALVLAPGAVQLLRVARPADAATILPGESEALALREVAHALRDRAGDDSAVVFASPNTTSQLCFHGSLRGVGTLYWENRAGLHATFELARATSWPAARAQLERARCRFIVLPSWDGYLAALASSGKTPADSAAITDSMVDRLQRWELPSWLRPVPCAIPALPGIEGQSVAVFEIVPEQTSAVASAQLAEYFLETGQLDRAVQVRARLRDFPRDLSALTALAQVEAQRGDLAAFSAVFAELEARVSADANAGDLAWDRRVMLANVLALGQRADLAREQLRRCLAEIDAARVRALTPGARRQLARLCRAFDLEIADADLRRLAARLLPPAARSE